MIARWTTTDPKGEFFSPYLANANNPVSTIDPDGGSTNSGSCQCSYVKDDGTKVSEILPGQGTLYE